MCTFNITVSDQLLEQARPTIGLDADITQWLQRQVEALLRRMAAMHTSEQYTYSDDMQKILSMPRRDIPDVGLNGERVRDEYYRERYSL